MDARVVFDFFLCEPAECGHGGKLCTLFLLAAPSRAGIGPVTKKSCSAVCFVSILLTAAAFHMLFYSNKLLKFRSKEFLFLLSVQSWQLRLVKRAIRPSSSL